MEQWKEKRHWLSDQVCKKNISGFLSINRQRDIFCNFPQLFTCDYHEKILHAGKVLLQISCYEPWARAWSTNHGPTERKLLNRDVEKWSGFHSHFLSNFDRKKDYVRIRTIISSQKNMLRPPAPSRSRSNGEKEKSLSAFKVACSHRSSTMQCRQWSECCTVARDPALWSVVYLCA